MITIENIEYSYDGALKKALDGVSLEIGDGEFVAIVGHNGRDRKSVV